MSQQAEYVLGTDEAEVARLGLQHRLWAGYAHDAWLRAGFTPGQTLIDVGCGPGYATLDLAQLVTPTGKIVAVDESAGFVERLRGLAAAHGIRHIDARVADVQQLDLTPSSADGAWIRWVLCFVQSPAKVIAGLARAIRPGGILAIHDYFSYEAMALAPRCPVMERVVRAVGSSWRHRGGDPDVAGRLPAMLRDSGFELRELRPICRTARPYEPLWQWPGSFFANYVPKLVEMGLLTQTDQQAFEDSWQQRSRDPDNFFCTPPVYELLAVRR